MPAGKTRDTSTQGLHTVMGKEVPGMSCLAEPWGTQQGHVRRGQGTIADTSWPHMCAQHTEPISLRLLGSEN